VAALLAAGPVSRGIRLYLKQTHRESTHNLPVVDACTDFSLVFLMQTSGLSSFSTAVDSPRGHYPEYLLRFQLGKPIPRRMGGCESERGRPRYQLCRVHNEAHTSDALLARYFRQGVFNSLFT